MKISIGDVSLYFDTCGMGLVPVDARMRPHPTLVLLHGGPGFDHSYFKPGFCPLADEMQLIFVDHRGNGRSDRSDPAHWSLEVWANDLSRFLRALNIVRPVILGNSFGGMVAQEFAAMYPNELSGLILYSTTATSPYAESAFEFKRLGGPEAGAAADAFFKDPYADTVLERFSAACFPCYSRKGWDATISERAVANPDVLKHFFDHELRHLDLRSRLGRVVAPTLILAGTDDPITPIGKAREIHECMPKGISELRVYEAGRHLLHLDEPQRLLGDVREFVKRIDDVEQAARTVHA